MVRNSSHQFGTNFQDLVAKVKNLVALPPVLGAILHPALGKFEYDCFNMMQTICDRNCIFHRIAILFSIYFYFFVNRLL